MNSTSPKSSLAKIGLHTKPRPFRILILGSSNVGKTGTYVILNTVDLINFNQYKYTHFDIEYHVNASTLFSFESDRILSRDYLFKQKKNFLFTQNLEDI